MCVQLDLFSGVSLQEPFEALTEDTYLEMVKRSGIADAVINFDPCPKCCYFGLCDSDDCAMHGFKLDSRKPLKSTYYEWYYK